MFNIKSTFMKAKFKEDLLNKEQVVMVKAGTEVEFTLTSKDGKTYANLKLDKPLNVPINVIVSKCLFGAKTKEELIANGFIKEAAPAADAAPATKQEPAKDTAKQHGSEDAGSKELTICIATALLRLQGICKGQLFSFLATSISEKGISGEVVFGGSSMPALIFNINAEDLLNDSFEKSIEAFVKEKTATGITNSEEVLATLNEQIENRKKELDELNKKAAAKPAAKGGAKTTTTAAKKEEKKEDPKPTLFEQEESTAAAAAEEEFPEDEETPESEVAETFDDDEFNE